MTNLSDLNVARRQKRQMIPVSHLHAECQSCLFRSMWRLPFLKAEAIVPL